MDALALAVVQQSHLLAVTVGVALACVPLVVYVVFGVKKESAVLPKDEPTAADEMLVSELPKMPSFVSLPEEEEEAPPPKEVVLAPAVLVQEDAALWKKEPTKKEEVPPDVELSPREDLERPLDAGPTQEEPAVVEEPAVPEVKTFTEEEEEEHPSASSSSSLSKAKALAAEPASSRLAPSVPLEKSVTHPEVPEAGFGSVSTYDAQGGRPTMEDAHFVVPLEDGVVAAVFDGCGGKRASEFARDRMKTLVEKEDDLRACIEATEKATLLAARKGGNWPDACAVVLASLKEDALDVAWLGDSRAVLARGGSDDDAAPLKAHCLTRDHNAGDAREEKRIKLAGGRVARSVSEARAGSAKKFFGKVVGSAVAFSTHKNNPKRVWPGGITLTRCVGALPLKYAKPQLVIATPETATIHLRGDERFLVLASDGVFENLDDQAVVQIVHDAAGQQNPAKALIEAAQASGSKDNITAIVLALNSPHRLQPLMSTI
mmetsp:Transcript_16542/g.53860  ORF Transcript_16542/g.53860 Transcript_16542/m.53860 type:complete len:489 (-) Transcript_16542:678-2144(-)|eukprot:CAMPEP_0118905488 /NCGR_PEP_ID=MMETSP1166-20130328/9472_1 /TAXON_ID=1104430 /ORGANISM="Chrysoreinhardia sp, Strain CCMP3193" /LENGTH=488 /DNA_ID=CAMNT_0006844759 /DNA_START=42 /DNA_END=1508 /DNA_ORIENTATION=-